MPLHRAPVPRNVVKGVGGRAGGLFEVGTNQLRGPDGVLNPVELGYVLPTYVEGQDAYVFGIGQ